MRAGFRLFHAAGDYVVGVLLLLGPWVFGFSADSHASMVTRAFGAVLIACNLFTDYQLGAYRWIPLAGRAALDMALGGVLIAAPWIFHFADTTWIPHLVIGIVTASRGIAWILATITAATLGGRPLSSRG